MSEPEKHPVETKLPAPRFAVRLALWFGLYLGGASFVATFFIKRFADGFDFGFMDYLSSIGVVMLAFPGGLIVPFFLKWARDGSTLTLALLLDGGPALAYSVYIVHLWFVWNVKTRRAFWALMLGMILLVGLNLTGCHKFTSDPDPSDSSHDR